MDFSCFLFQTNFISLVLLAVKYEIYVNIPTDQLSDVAINNDTELIKKFPSYELIISIVLAWIHNDIIYENN